MTGGTFDTPLGRRNVIRNGDASVYQRGAWTTNAYGVDGWRCDSSGGTVTPSRQVAPAGTGMGTNGAGYYLRSVVSGQSLAGDFARFTQRIEGVRTLAGKSVSLSFLATPTGPPKIGVEVVQNFGTGGSPSATVNTAIQAVALAAGVNRYSVSFTVPSIAGKAFGTNNDDFLEVNLWLSAGADNAARASAIGFQNTTIDITDVQLEQGGATPFERLSQQEQLAWCQRYYERVTSPAANTTIIGSGRFNTTTTG